jgi:hypothetical protein
MARFDPDPPFGSVLRRLRQERSFTIEEAAKRAQVVARILVGMRVSWAEFALLLDAPE